MELISQIPSCHMPAITSSSYSFPFICPLHICDLSLLAIGAKDKLPEWANKMKEVISGCCPTRYSKYKHGQAPLPLSDLYFLHSISPRPAMTIQRANSCDKYLVNFQRLCLCCCSVSSTFSPDRELQAPR